jgi:hypothetical protein
MVRMKVGEDEPRQGATSKRAGEERLPGLTRASITEPCIDDSPADAILDEVDVHVVEPEGQGKASPQKTRSNLDEFAWRGRRGMGKAKLCVRREVSHSSLVEPWRENRQIGCLNSAMLRR